jgi:dTDP-4-amino-4,6-dideoxygalactose transaminase
LIASDVGENDVVITVSNTFVATVEAILQARATAHLVDVDPNTFNMSVDALRQYLETQCHKPEKSLFPIHRATGKTVKAIMPVHLYGQMCDMDEIMSIAEKYGLMVFEDACQAHGSEYFSKKSNRWQKAGSIGKAAAFSFYPGKNLGACGEAGAVTTDDEQLAIRIKMIRDHGQNKKYHHLVEGYNGRLDAIQAAFLRRKLPHLAGWNENRRAVAARYNRLLKEVTPVTTPAESSSSRSNYHLYVIRTAQRDELQSYLGSHNIATGLHYPVPIHLQQAYQGLGFKSGELPVTERLSKEILSLPMYPQLTPEQQSQVSNRLLEFFQTVSEDVLQTTGK